MPTEQGLDEYDKFAKSFANFCVIRKKISLSIDNHSKCMLQ